jgi:hypothetical protein
MSEPKPELGFLQKYVYRNPYTGAALIDVEEISKSSELRALLRSVWESGYSAGFVDGDGDSTVDMQSVNPFK